jgi:hypothetical protein
MALMTSIRSVCAVVYVHSPQLVRVCHIQAFFFLFRSFSHVLKTRYMKLFSSNNLVDRRSAGSERLLRFRPKLCVKYDSYCSSLVEYIKYISFADLVEYIKYISFADGKEAHRGKGLLLSSSLTPRTVLDSSVRHEALCSFLTNSSV